METSPSPAPQPLRPIPTPLKLRVRRVRYQIVPILVFLVATIVVCILWSRHAGIAHGIGEVSVLATRVPSPMDGVLVAPSGTPGFPKLYDRVTAGQLLARFDSSRLIEQQDRAYNDLKKLRDELDGVNKQIEVAKAARTAAPATPSPAPAAGQSLSQLQDQARSLRASVDYQEEQYARMERRVKESFVRATADGVVTAITYQPGDFVREGQSVLTITPDQGDYIVTYIRPESPVQPKKDMKVLVRSGQRAAVTSIVQEVGNQVQPIPEQQLANSRRPEWGIPVRIAMPDSKFMPLRPGERVSIAYQVDK